MTPFVTVTSPVLALFEDRIDTDVIFPARFLLLMEKAGLGQYLFHDRRFAGDGTPLSNPIDPAMAARARILLASRDFGCGSSREQAVWSLADAGIACVVAESFGEIFAANCLRNGVLTIRMAPDQIAALAKLAENGALTVDLPAQRIGHGDDWRGFDVVESARQRLLNGWDEIDTVVARAGDGVDRFEAWQRRDQPWLYGGPTA